MGAPRLEEPLIFSSYTPFLRATYLPTYLGMEEIQLEMNGMSNNSSLCVCYFYRNFYKYKSRLVFVVARFWEKPCRNFGEIFDKTVPDGKRLS